MWSSSSTPTSRWIPSTSSGCWTSSGTTRSWESPAVPAMSAILPAPGVRGTAPVHPLGCLPRLSSGVSPRHSSARRTHGLGHTRLDEGEPKGVEHRRSSTSSVSVITVWKENVTDTVCEPRSSRARAHTSWDTGPLISLSERFTGCPEILPQSACSSVTRGRLGPGNLVVPTWSCKRTYVANRAGGSFQCEHVRLFDREPR